MSEPISSSVDRHGSFVPMQSLHERIDEVRSNQSDLPSHLRAIAAEIPGSSIPKTLNLMADAVEAGASGAQLANRFPDHCWLLTLQSSAATTDALTVVLEQTAYQHRMQLKRLRTVAYPTILLSITFAMVLLALAFLIPPFDQMYQEFELQLPAPTLMLVNASRWLNSTPLLAILSVVLFIGLLSATLWIWISDNPLKRNLLGPSVRLSAIRQSLAKVALQVSELCDEGIDLARALRIAAESNPNGAVRGLIADLAVTASRDTSNLSNTRAATFLPPNFVFALRPPPRTSLSEASTAETADASRPNTHLLRELASSYREITIGRRDWASFALAQVCILGIGMMIGFVVLALFMPLVSLINALS